MINWWIDDTVVIVRMQARMGEDCVIFHGKTIL
jgi:serine acetyltransferase